MGLFNGSTGLSYGSGLIYPIVPGHLPIVDKFTGAGGLTVSASVALSGLAVFSGGGNLSALASGRYLTNPAKFGGAGSLSAVAS